MDILTLASLREAIARVFASWEAYPSAISRFKIVGVNDGMAILESARHRLVDTGLVNRCK